MSGQFWLTDKQVERLRPHFPKVRGKPRVDDRRVLSGILHVLRNGLRWRDAPAVYRTHDMNHGRDLCNMCNRPRRKRDLRSWC